MPCLFLNRRSFLKHSFLATIALSAGGLGWAGQLHAAKKPANRLSLLHLHTGERLAVNFRDSSGGYVQQALEAIDRLLRCHHTEEIHPIDIRTLEYLSQVDRKLGGNHEIHIVSGYRSPRYNKMLHAQGRQVAKRSLHLEGRALDIRIPGVRTASLRKAALDLQLGGVGYYPRSDFVHLDSGAFRSW